MFCAECGQPATDGQKFCTRCGSPLASVGAAPDAATMATPPPLPSDPGRGGLDPTDVYASFARRFFAVLIDHVLLFAVAVAMALAMGGAQDRSRFFSLGWIILVWLYFALMESSTRQATIGKRALGIKVCTTDGQRISFGRATGRFFGRWLSSLLLYIGYLMAAFTRRRQALHDLIADTLVVREAADAEDVRTAIAPRGGAGAVVTIVVVVFVMLFGIGMLAAIAIPAYQDYTIRAQVTEGLMAANALKQPIADRLAGGTPPTEISSETIDAPLPALRYVDAVRVENAAILLRYGEGAHRAIAGKTLLLVPALGDGDVFWICGRGDAPARFEPVMPNYARYTSIEPKYLPSVCR